MKNYILKFSRVPGRKPAGPRENSQILCTRKDKNLGDIIFPGFLYVERRTDALDVFIYCGTF